MRSSQRLLTSASALALAAACADLPGDASAQRIAPTVEDSAGVQIVRAGVPARGVADDWRIESEPFLSIGEVEGDETYLFSNVQTAGRLPDGRIFVVDDAPHNEIRVYDGDGRFSEAWGGAGEGPGEFGISVRTLVPYRGDSVVAIEYIGRRMHVFDAEGRFGRRILPRYDWALAQNRLPSQSCCIPQFALPDGSWVVEYPEEVATDGSGRRRGGVRVVRVSADGELLGEFGVFPAGLWREAPRQHPSPVMSVRFTGRVSLAARDEHVLAGNGVEYRVDELDAYGTLVRSFRVDLEPPPFQAADQRAYEDYTRSRYVESRGELDARTEAMLRAQVENLPDRLPAYSQIMVDPEGRIWLVSAPVPGVTSGRDALVLDADGAVLGRVDLPDGVRPVQIGRDEIIAVGSDDMGVSRVFVYRIVRPERAG